MGGISGIGGSDSYNNIYGNIASGNRIQKAADDAAGMSIAEKQESQVRSQNMQQRNQQSQQDAVNIADGARSGVSNYLQAINELSVQSMNGLYSDSDRQAIQNQINAYTSGIEDTYRQARYNETSVLGDARTSIRSLGMENFNITGGNADLNTVSGALENVSAARSSDGARYNGLSSSISNLATTAENTDASISRIKDEDIGEASTKLKNKQVMDQYQNQMQRKEMDDQTNFMNKMFGG